MDDGVAVVTIRGSELHALDAGTGQVIWRKRCVGTHTFALVDGVVYCANASARSDPGLVNTIYAVDAMTGEEIWSYGPDPGWVPDRMFISDDALIIRPKAFRVHMHIALDADTGRLLWQAHIGGVTNDVADGAMYEYSTAEVAAIDVATGHDRWRREVPEGTSVEGAGSGVVFIHEGGGFSALSGETGLDEWRYERRGRTLFLTGVEGEVAIIKSRERSMGPYPEIHPIDEFCAVDTQTGRDLWCRNVEDAFIRLQGEAVYLSSESLVALLDAQTGRELWSYDRERGAGEIAQASRGDDNLYTHINGTVSSLDHGSLRVRWQYQLEWDGDDSDGQDGPFIAAADDDIVVLWTGAGLTAVGPPPPGEIRAAPTQEE